MMPELKIRNLCFDSANDNYPTYKLCRDWTLFSFIDRNFNRDRPEFIPKRITIDNDETPHCQTDSV